MANQEEKQNVLFTEMKTMIAQSVGRIPTGIVVILLISLVMAVGSGLALKIMTPEKSANQFLPLRLDVSSPIPAIDTKKISGTWIYQTPDYAMSFSFIGDRFEWLVKFADTSDTQFYARGNYRLEGDVLILGVRADLGKPYDPKRPWTKYLPMAMRNLNVKATRDGNKLVWIVPPSEQENIISHTSRIFENNADGKFIWVRL
jgi:hypothetical protein